MFSKAMYLLDQCITSPTAEKTHAWFHPMLFDAAYLHALCFTIPTYFDNALPRTRNIESKRKDCVYYAKTVATLRERLALTNDSDRFSDSTVMTILALSGHAYTTGDYESAHHHNSGLLKLVSMRGVDTFHQNIKLLIEVIRLVLSSHLQTAWINILNCRCDLGMSMDRTSKPVLFAYNDIPWRLPSTPTYTILPSLQHVSPQPQCELDKLLTQLHPELAAIYEAMSNFCTLINAAAESRGDKITEERFMRAMGSIMYRLLNQRFETHSADEAFRLGLLAFAAPIFLHWNRVELPDRRFTSAFREALAELDPKTPIVESRAVFWLLMIGAVSMSHEPETLALLTPLLRNSMKLCHVLTWDDIQNLLCSILWIGLIHDDQGRHVFYIMSEDQFRDNKDDF